MRRAFRRPTVQLSSGLKLRVNTYLRHPPFARHRERAASVIGRRKNRKKMRNYSRLRNPRFRWATTSLPAPNIAHSGSLGGKRHNGPTDLCPVTMRAKKVSGSPGKSWCHNPTPSGGWTTYGCDGRMASKGPVLRPFPCGNVADVAAALGRNWKMQMHSTTGNLFRYHGKDLGSDGVDSSCATGALLSTMMERAAR